MVYDNDSYKFGPFVPLMHLLLSKMTIPLQIVSHAHLKVPPLHPIRTSYPFSRGREQLPPRIRHPGEIEQFDPLCFRCALVFHHCGDKPISSTDLGGTKKTQSCFHRGILRRGSEGDDGEQTKEHGAVALVGGPQKLLVRVSGIGEVLFTLLEDLLALLPKHTLDGGKAFLRGPLLAVGYHQVTQSGD